MRLKSDLFGTVSRIARQQGAETTLLVERNTHAARWWLRPLAYHLARREARALRVLRGMSGVPELHSYDGAVLIRSWIDGSPMQLARPRDPAYFRAALVLVRRLHRVGVAHNDLAKEPNWLVTAAGLPALVDFQLALISPNRSRLFRTLAREDIRHLLKHKRTYCENRLTRRQRRILATPSIISRLWMSTGKRLYLGVTRGLLGWADREGAGDRDWENARKGARK